GGDELDVHSVRTHVNSRPARFSPIHFVPSFGLLELPGRSSATRIGVVQPVDYHVYEHMVVAVEKYRRLGVQHQLMDLGLLPHVSSSTAPTPVSRAGEVARVAAHSVVNEGELPLGLGFSQRFAQPRQLFGSQG